MHGDTIVNDESLLAEIYVTCSFQSVRQIDMNQLFEDFLRFFINNSDSFLNRFQEICIDELDIYACELYADRCWRTIRWQASYELEVREGYLYGSCIVYYKR